MNRPHVISIQCPSIPIVPYYSFAYMRGPFPTRIVLFRWSVIKIRVNGLVPRAVENRRLYRFNVGYYNIFVVTFLECQFLKIISALAL